MCDVVGLSSLSKVKKFLFFFLSRKGERGCVFAVFFSPIPEKEILDFIAHGSIIQVFTVVEGGKEVQGIQLATENRRLCKHKPLNSHLTYLKLGHGNKAKHELLSPL